MTTAVSQPDALTDPPLRIGRHTLTSRLIVGTGKYDTFETMQRSLALSETDCITVAVRRERLYDGQGKTSSISSISIVTRCSPIPPAATTQPTRCVSPGWDARFCSAWKTVVPTG